MKHATWNKMQNKIKSKLQIIPPQRDPAKAVANYKLQAYRGFSFIEVMLSVFLLSIGMGAAISLIGAGLKESIDSRNQLIASLLTQEGVELVRNIRDTNWVTPGNVSFSGFPAADPAICRVDPRSIDDLSQCVGQSKVLKYDGTLRLYNHTTGTNTRFLRQITISNSGNKKIVTSMVIWKAQPWPAIAGCTTGASCAYAQETMTAWSSYE